MLARFSRASVALVLSIATATGAGLGCASLWGFEPLTGSADGGSDAPSDGPHLDARVEAGANRSEPSCTLEGTASRCGQCIAPCVDTLSPACCRDPSCAKRMLPLAGDCALGDAAACAQIAGEVVSSTPNVANLATCIDQGCLGPHMDCPTRSPTTSTTCILSGLEDASTCSCNLYPGSSNDLVCSSARFPGTRCCAEDGWPDAATRDCLCQAITCEATMTGGSCTCSLALVAGGTTTCAGTFCCQTFDQCYCGTTPCNPAYQTQVATCTLATIGCPMGYAPVETCTVAAP